MKRLILVVAIFAVSACAQRGTITVDTVARNFGTIEPIFIGTTRAFDTAKNEFGSDRSATLSLALVDVSVPPDRQPGEITWPKRGRPPNPRTDFLTADQRIFPNEAAFRTELGRAMRQEPGRRNRALIFVHGFNNTYAEGVYRIAQLSHDLDLPRVTVHYSWPSLANPLGYVYDRDSAAFARDGLEKLINETIAAGADEVILVAHSMGSLLLMEAMRQMEIRQPGRLSRYLKGVVLMSPDIDVEVFRSQAATFRNLPQPFLIFSSQKDRALRLSALITGNRDRLGNLTDLTEVENLDVQVVDVQNFSTGAGHFTVGDSPEFIALLNRIGDVQNAFDADRSGNIGLFPGIVLTAQRATAVVVKPLEIISDELQK